MNTAFDHRLEFESLPGLVDHPRVDLGPIRTPLMHYPRLSEKLGIELYIKRDDTQPLAMGGNKVRQLEFYLGPAKEQGADTVLITGAVQSNFVRLCAAACRRLGWKPVVQLEDRVTHNAPSYADSGNVLLDKMLGAEIHYFPEGENEAAADANLDQLAKKERQAGRKPYVIHLGTDHPPYGGLGYALGAAETKLQCDAVGFEPDHVVLPSGSGLSHGGFLSGVRALQWNVLVHGICVRRTTDLQTPRIAKRCAEIDALLGKECRGNEEDVLTHDHVFHPGYGQMNDKIAAAITLAATEEALLMDPVYVGKGFAGLVDLIDKGVIRRGEKVIFIHTGGTPGIFAYAKELSVLD